HCLLPSAYCLLPSAFCFLGTSPQPSAFILATARLPRLLIFCFRPLRRRICSGFDRPKFLHTRRCPDEIPVGHGRAPASAHTTVRRFADHCAAIHPLCRHRHLPVPSLRHLHTRRWTRASGPFNRQLRTEP